MYFSYCPKNLSVEKFLYRSEGVLYENIVGKYAIVTLCVYGLFFLPLFSKVLKLLLLFLYLL